MRIRSNIFQKKEQYKTSGKKLKVEISNLPNKEFWVMTIKILTELRRGMDEHSENVNKELENIKNQTKWKNTIIEIH